jgi:hypothetical protein
MTLSTLLFAFTSYFDRRSIKPVNHQLKSDTGMNIECRGLF